MATKKYERIAGSEDAMILREALEKLSESPVTASLEGAVGRLLEEMKMARSQREKELEVLRESIRTNKEMPVHLLEAFTNSVQAPVVNIDTDGIVSKIATLLGKKPNYSFKVERNPSGQLVGITATAGEG